MNLLHIRFKQIMTAAAMTTALFLPLSSTRAAQTELSVLYAFPDLFRPVMEDLGKQFMAKNPDIKILWRAPAPEYEQVLQTALRESVAGTQPDVTMQGLNNVRALSDQGDARSLDAFIAADKNFAQHGLPPSILAAGSVKGQVYALPFAISLPVLYYNADLVKRAGGDPAHLPTTWNEVISLAEKINALGSDTNGIFYAWDETGNWMWQSLLFSHGGAMLDESEQKVAFDDGNGQWAIGLLARLVRETHMPYITHTAARQQFAAGSLGILATSTSQLATIQKITAGHFTLAVGTYPDLKPGISRLPSGGNGLMITAKDPVKQQAAWRFITFMTQPESAAKVARSTGYFPPDGKAGALLTDFYQANPNFAVAVKEQPYASGWYAFPGSNGLKIIDVIKDRLESVVSGRHAADSGAVLTQMSGDVQALLPQK